jgi:hypothetical protein
MLLVVPGVLLGSALVAGICLLIFFWVIRRYEEAALRRHLFLRDTRKMLN